VSQISEALDRMRLDLSECQESTVYRPLDPLHCLRNLSATVEALEKRYDRLVAPKPPLDPEEVWARWRGENYDLEKLDRREKRTLCIGPQTAMRARLIQSLAGSPDALERVTTFTGFVHAYFANWREMENPEAAEALIRRILEELRIARKSRVLDSWKHSDFLFSAQAPQRVGEMMIRDRKSVGRVCAELYIDSSTPLIKEAQRRATVLASKGLISRQIYISEPEAVSELNWILDNLLGPGLIPATYRTAMSDFITSQLPERLPGFQKVLVEVIHRDDRLGDPRLAGNAPGWRTMLPEAKERFLAWLAKETLQFFFDTLVPSNDENRRRAKFWLQYAKKQRNVKDFQVAVSDNDVYKIKASRAKTIPSYSRVIGGNTSAFLMVFEGYGKEYIVIEFSETGNAAYIYTREQFESGGNRLRSYSFHLTDVLKRKGDEESRIIHNGDWEPKARRTLSELGIRP
jgi:hypothetical protein